MTVSSGCLAEEIRPSNVEIRKGNAADFAQIARLAEAVYGVRRSVDSVRWLYEANPAGPCKLWLAEDCTTKDIVALRPVFPWRFRIRGHDALVGQAGDAMTHPAFRGQGLFSALVRASWSELRDEGVPFSFSFSNPGSLSVYRKITIGVGQRAGTHVVLQFRRMVCPLSLRVVCERVPVLDGVARGADRAYRGFQRRRWALPRHLSVFPVERFDEEFDELWSRTADRCGVLTVRDSRYLNWRFLDPPTAPFQVLGLRSHGCLAGYVAFEVDGEGYGHVADLFGPPEPEIIGALLAASLTVMLERGCIKASIGAAMDCRFFPLIRQLGFLPREESVPMAVHVYHDGPGMDAVLDAGEWLAWFGDRDVEHLAAAPFRR